MSGGYTSSVIEQVRRKSHKKVSLVPDCRAADRDGSSEITVMNADGSNRRNPTYNSADDGSPAWQPAPGAVASGSGE
jgi:hypothetical protein